MFCGAALTFPGSGDGLLVVAMFRMVIALVAGVGRVSCAQVLRNSRLSPAADRLRSMEPRPTTIYCRKMQIFREKILKKFGSSEIMPTFAIPFGKQVVTLLELKIKTSKSDMGNGEIR